MTHEDMNVEFEKAFTKEYLDFLKRKSVGDMDLVGVLWMGFCSGMNSK